MVNTNGELKPHHVFLAFNDGAAATRAQEDIRAAGALKRSMDLALDNGPGRYSLEIVVTDDGQVAVRTTKVA